MADKIGIHGSDGPTGENPEPPLDPVIDKSFEDGEDQENNPEVDETIKADSVHSSGADHSEHSGITIELQEILFENLSRGFTELRDRHSEDEGDPQKTNVNDVPSSSCVSVNFIDTTSGISAPSSSTNKFSLLGQRNSKAVTSEATLSLNLYEKFTTIFEQEYACTVQSVAYENVRNGSAGVVDRLRVRPVLANRDNAPSTLAPEGDPAEWHNGAYCHVYIAACESVEHYRGKVRPALQAFVSQIEGPTTSSLTASLPRRNSLEDSAVPVHGNFSPHYVVVYVPVGSKRSDTTSSSDGTATRVGAAFASRMAAARRQLQNNSRDLSGDSTHSQATNGTDGTDSELDSSDLANVLPNVTASNVTKVEKDILKKFATDFPSGNTCIMSSLIDQADSNSSDSAVNPVRAQEWNTFLRLLGAAIASGFKGRCRRYDDELRRLDAQRASIKPSSSVSISSKAVGRNQFDFSNFFCVKESLAFTYEQMHLPEEALLQYEELRAFVPEVSGEDNGENEENLRKLTRDKSSSWHKAVVFEHQTMPYALAGDSSQFRRQLRSSKDVTSVAYYVILQYIFCREATLLLQLGNAVEIIRRSRSFSETFYKSRVKRIAALGPHDSVLDRQNLRVDIENWTLNFCWYVKCACEVLFDSLSSVEPAIDRHAPNMDDDTLGVELDAEGSSEVVDVPVISQRASVSRRDLARSIAELLEFARVRLLYLGDVGLTCENPVRTLCRSKPDDIFNSWIPWSAIDGSVKTIQIDTEEISGTKEPDPFLQGVFQSREKYETKYIALSSALCFFLRSAGRVRSAAAMQGELVELHIRRGDLRIAAEILNSISDVTVDDQWDRCHLWLLFRLAYCQRMIRNPINYIKTLARCFGRRLSSLMPKQTANLLHCDLEALVREPEIAETRLGAASFIDMEISIQASSNLKATGILDYMRKRVVKNAYAVGETVHFSLNITSYLPRVINVAGLETFLVPLHEFESFVRGRGLIKDHDGFVGLPLPSPLTIHPGSNEFSFAWRPMSTGEFMVAMVSLQWKEAVFHYSYMALRKTLIEIDVVQSEPTQTLELNPLFLMPGHVQQVRIVFHAGSDIIRSGKVYLESSNGLSLLPPGTDPGATEWMKSCAIDLPPCQPKETTVLRLLVKSENDKSPSLTLDDVQESVIQKLHARVATSYHHASFDTLNQGDKAPCMKTVLEAMVTTLDRPALSVDATDLIALDDRMTMLTINLHCNTPQSLSIKGWDVNLQRTRVKDDGDMNGEVLNQSVLVGDQVSLGFICEPADESVHEFPRPQLRMVLEDQFQKTFDQVLPLDLDVFSDHTRKRVESVPSEAVTGELRCSALEGLVGTPVDLTFTLSMHTEACWPGDVHYHVSAGSEWVLGGKIEGELGRESGDTSLQFVGIPTCPGVLTSFPGISVMLYSRGEMKPVNVNIVGPDSFKSLSFSNHMALACSSSVDATT